MKRLPILICSFFLLTAFIAKERKQQKPYHWQEVTSLKGKVKSVTFASVKRIDVSRLGKVVRVLDTFQTRTILLDKAGSTTYYSSRRREFVSGTVEVYTDTFDEQVYTFRYNANGDMVKRTIALGDTPWAYEVDYDKDGKEVGSRDYDQAGAVIEKTVLEYDKTGGLVSSRQYHERGGQYLSERTWYFNKGKQTKTETYRRDGSIKGWNNTSRDTFGNREEYIEDGSRWGRDARYEKTVTTFGHDGKVISTAVYRNKYDMDVSKVMTSFDMYGNKLDELTYSADGDLVNKEIWKYDEHGNETESLVYSDGKLRVQSTTAYNYNSRAQLIEKTRNTIYPPERGIVGETIRELYSEYDAKGNYRRNTTIIKRGNGDLDTVLHLRAIQYYK